MIIDTHIHRGPMPNQFVCDYCLERLLKSMDALDISFAVSCNTSSLLLEDFILGAEQAESDYTQSGGRIKSYFYYQPKYASDSLAVMKAYRNHPAFCGIKIHPSWAFTSADDEHYRPVWKYAKEGNLPILSHTWDASSYNPKQIFSFPSRFEKYVQEYPDVTLILAHSGGRYNGILAAVKLGEAYPNVYYDTAGDIYANGFLEYLVSHVGSRRVMFGSDYTMMDQRTMLGVVLGADLPVADKENILYNTAQKVFVNITQTTRGK